jgi:hypothetical protein
MGYAPAVSANQDVNGVSGSQRCYIGVRETMTTPFLFSRAARILYALLVLGALILSSIGAIPATAIVSVQQTTPANIAENSTLGPQPGETFRQYTFPSNFDLCNGVTSSICVFGGQFMSNQSTKNLTVNNSTNTTRAELAIEYWGGHINTANQRLNVNGGSAQPIPQPSNIPAGSHPRCYYRTMLNALAPLPLGGDGGLRAGNQSNSFTFGIDTQIEVPECESGSSYSWGQLRIYAFTARVYYDVEANARPTGTITTPANGAVIVEPANRQVNISVQAAASSGRTISRVDLIGNYLGTDRDGNGVLQEWQYTLRDGVWENTIGTRTSPSSGTNTNGTYNFTWDTTWLPDQPGPIQLMARVTDNSGLSYMTPIAAFTLQRTNRSVQLYAMSSDYYGQRVFGAPRAFGAKLGINVPAYGRYAYIAIPHALTNATAARFDIFTWSGNPCCDVDENGAPINNTGITEVWVNNSNIWNSSYGIYHNFDYDTITISPTNLVRGDNIIRIYSSRENHALEVLWPGPMILVQYSGTAPAIPPPVAENLSLNTNEDTPLNVTLPVTNQSNTLLSYTLSDSPDNGQLAGKAPNLTYQPNPNYFGTDSFSYTISDMYGNSVTSTVNVNVTSVPDQPIVTLNGNPYTPFGTPFSISGSFTDADSNTFSAVVDYGDGSAPKVVPILAGNNFTIGHNYARSGVFPVTLTVNDGTTTGVASILVQVVSPGSTPVPDNWWNTSWRYRIPVTINSGAYPRLNKVVETSVNFTAALQSLDRSGSLIINSIRVVEVGAAGSVIDAGVPYQFDPANNFNTASNASGALLILLKGNTAANTTRTYHVYFETSGSFSAPVFPSLVAITNPSLADYQTDDTLVIETRDPEGGNARNATYYFHRTGGGFASIMDRNNVDWITYRPRAGTTGEFRGLPNSGAVFHPGYKFTYPSNDARSQYNRGGSQQASTTTVMREGILKTTISVVSSNNLWRATWDFYPTSVRLTMQQNASAAPYWFLYEGTPGGTLEATDRLVLSNGTAIAAAPFTGWEGDLGSPGAGSSGSEWAYFRAGEAQLGGRALFLSNLDDTDFAADIYRYRNDDPTFAASGAMTIFGFGRTTFSTALLTNVPRQFVFGFVENAPASYDSAYAQRIEGIYRDIAAGSVGIAQEVLSNFAPLAIDDRYRVDPGTTLIVPAPGVRANDGDGDNDPTTLNLVSDVANGTLTLNANGSFTYIPNAGFEGIDEFSYTLNDGVATSEPATVRIFVSINNPPVVVNDEFTALKGTPLTIPAPGVLSNDTDLEGNDLTAQLVNEPSNGTLSLETDGSFTYTPDAGFSGVDIFTYTASDGEFGSVEATVTITVINRPPTVNDRSYNVAPDIALNVAPPGILAGANDPDGDPLTAQLVRGPRHGVLTVNPNGSFTYTPLSGYVGADDFIFRVSDGNLSSNPATVRLTIGNEGTVRVRQYLAFLGR